MSKRKTPALDALYAKPLLCANGEVLRASLIELARYSGWQPPSSSAAERLADQTAPAQAATFTTTTIPAELARQLEEITKRVYTADGHRPAGEIPLCPEHYQQITLEFSGLIWGLVADREQLLLAEQKRYQEMCEAYNQVVEKWEGVKQELRDFQAAVRGDYWKYQGDGCDELESLVCPVVIEPVQLLDLLAAANQWRELQNKQADQRLGGAASTMFQGDEFQPD